MFISYTNCGFHTSLHSLRCGKTPGVHLPSLSQSNESNSQGIILMKFPLYYLFSKIVDFYLGKKSSIAGLINLMSNFLSLMRMFFQLSVGAADYAVKQSSGNHRAKRNSEYKVIQMKSSKRFGPSNFSPLEQSYLVRTGVWLGRRPALQWRLPGTARLPLTSTGPYRSCVALLANFILF